jgi:hypothetical protein
MRKTLIPVLLLCIISIMSNCKEDTDNENNGTDSGNKDEQTYTIIYQLNSPVPPSIPGMKPSYDVEAVGGLPIDNNKYKSGDTVTLLPLPEQLKYKNTIDDMFVTMPYKWVIFENINKNYNRIGDVFNSGDNFIIHNNTIVTIDLALQFDSYH